MEANFTDTSPAATITSFLKNIGSTISSPTGTIALQKNLITALDKLQSWFKCIADKQHAIAIVINDCKSGRSTLSVLHGEAESSYDLNTQSCINDKIVPSTSIQKMQSIISSVAAEKGWNANCLLNNKDLLYRVCAEEKKGYVIPGDIVVQVNKSELTEDLVKQFLTMCPPPAITPKSRQDTCTYYCLYQPLQTIARFVGLLESQVKNIIPTCGICSVTELDKVTICHSYFCKGISAANIEVMVEKPLPTVNDVISKCVQKCVMKDSEKQEVCQRLKCKQDTSSTVASSLNLPIASIEELKPQCDTILQKCTVTHQQKFITLYLYCKQNTSANEIQLLVKLPLADVESIIKSQVRLFFTWLRANNLRCMINIQIYNSMFHTSHFGRVECNSNNR